MTAPEPVFASSHASRTGPEVAKALKAQLPGDPLTRFAPAPTGDLHLGHVVNAVYVWGLGRALGGRVLLRIEDHDRQRARGEAERLMLDDLDWLGFAADVYSSEDYRRGSCDGRQSERDAVYRHALAPLVAAGLVYGCTCSRATQPPDLPAVPVHQPERRYAGTCRNADIPLGDGVGWRLRLEPGIEAFDDAILGPQQQDPSVQCGDVLLRDRLGNWTYQCAAAIDDTVQGVTLVVRGHDLLSSTGRQIRLARLVGRQTPAAIVHHPLIMKSATQKLSKSDGDSGIRDLRLSGWSAAQVIGRAASLAGLTPEPDSLSVGDLPGLFGAESWNTDQGGRRS
jgi:glutamyl/glutaminyl-tRNA synthetase